MLTRLVIKVVELRLGHYGFLLVNWVGNDNVMIILKEKPMVPNAQMINF